MLRAKTIRTHGPRIEGFFLDTEIFFKFAPLFVKQFRVLLKISLFKITAPTNGPLSGSRC